MPIIWTGKIIIRFTQRNATLIALGILLGAAFFLVQRKYENTSQSLFPTYYKIGYAGKYSVNSLPKEISSLVSYGLTRLSTNGNPIPGAALSWEVENQGKRHVFHLDPNARWHDGSPLKSKDITSQLQGIEIKYPNDDTVIIETKTPFSPLPVSLSAPLFKKGKYGLGKYKITKITTSAGFISQLTIEAIETKNKQVLFFRFYPNQQSLVNAFILGEVDVIVGLSSLANLSDWNNLIIIPKQELDQRYVALFFNTSKDPLSDKRFRQALSYGIKKTKKQNRAFTPISPISWAYNKNIKTYPYDPGHANKILESAKTKNPELITITTISELSTQAEEIKENWEQNLGIQAEVKIVPAIQADQDFDVILGYGPISLDPDQYYLWHSDQPKNITKYSNPRIDKLLEEGRQVFSKEERKRIYQDFQRFLLEDVPALFLFFPETYQVSRYKLPGNLIQ